MEKVMYALWRPDHVDDPGFAEQLTHEIGPALSAAGARGVRLNVIDSDVSPVAASAPGGLRRSTMDPPIAALASIWVDSAVHQMRRPLDQVLADGGTRFAGYLVSESAPLPDTTSHIGRTDGFTQVAFLRRPARLDRAGWLERWHDHHTDVAVQTQSTFAYRQNLVVDSLHHDAPPFDAIVEESFPIAALTDWHAFYDAVGDDARFQANVEAMLASTATFIDYETDLDVLATSEYVLARP
ncbi:MAG: EthD domain-containing protein [Aquihabitans sp.]